MIAAASALGLTIKKTHWDKLDAARILHDKHGLPDIAALLEELNELRKGFSYGELVTEPSLSAQDIASEVETYVDAVQRFLDQAEDL